MLFAPIQKGHLLASAMEIHITTATEKHAPFTVSFPFIIIIIIIIIILLHTVKSDCISLESLKTP